MNLSKKQEYLIIAGLLVLIFPFFALLAYVHPQGDDFFFAYKMQSQGVFDFVKEMYFTWSGRYSSMFLGAIDPFAYNSIFGLRFSLVLLQLFTIFSIFLLVKSITTKKTSLTKLLIATLSFYIVFINSTISLFEFVFWYPVASAYQLAVALITIFLSLVLFENQNRLSVNIFLFLTAVVIFITIGLIELSIIPLGIISVLNIWANIKLKKNFYPSIVIVVIIIGFSLLMILAPGNYIRHDMIGNTINIKLSITLSIQMAIYTIGYLFQNPVFVLSSILFISFTFLKIKNNQSFSITIPRIKPWLIFLSSFVIIIFIFLPSVLILKHLPPSRVINFVSYFIMIIWVFDIVLIVNYYKNTFSFSIQKGVVSILVATTVIFSFSGVIIIDKNEFAHGNYKSIYFNGNIVKAYYILLFEAGKHDNHMNKRDAIIRNARKNGKAGVQIYPFKHNTSLINFINLNETNYSFNWEAKYYNLDSIYIEPRKKQSP